MTSQTQPEPTEDRLEEEAVARFLADNPGFFRDRPDLLEALDIPDTGGATSLLEHQVSVLRDKNQQHRRRLREYHAAAERNADLLERLHGVYRLMLDASSPDRLLDSVRAALLERFDCQAVAIGLFRGPVPDVAVDLSSGAAVEAFASQRENPVPAVGRLSQARLRVLFGEGAETLRSAALTPLDDDGEIGVLVLASEDEHTYHPGMGTLFIELLGRMLGESLRRLNARD